MDWVREIWSFATCGELIFGRNSIQRVAKVIEKLGGKNILVLTDPMIRDAGLLKLIEKPLGDLSISFAVYDQGMVEPTIEKVLECAEFAKKGIYDVIVCFGGGSIIDLGKATAVLMTHGRHPHDYFGEGKVPGPVKPILAVPTTAGTGSEVSPAAILTDVKANLKKGISDNHLRPRAVIVDPLLTLSCPPNVTAATGIDVLAHAIESYLAIHFAYLPLSPGEENTVLYHGSYPLTECLAGKAIELVSQNLRLAVDQGKNLEARTNMAMANIMAGMAFSNSGVTAVHAMAYPLGASSHAPHGVVNGLLLPHVMEFNLPVRIKELAAVAKALGENVDGLSLREAAFKSIPAVSALIRDIGLPTRMRDIGVKEKDIRPMAEATMQVTRLLRSNPRRVSVESLEEIYKRAF
ncbi:MAG: iron-containing alcohol dehydrogenase [Syntrophaceae bacterium]|nr:iron-containing alcohol dehydrogenase [Syntrophaceae bacterium]